MATNRKEKTIMKLLKTKGIVFFVTAAIFLSACEKKESNLELSTPEEAITSVMENLKDLNLTAFNECTDNYVQTYYNWIGVPVETEYRVFNELLQPGSKRQKRYETKYKLAQKITEKLTWEVQEIRRDTDTAEIDLKITTIDMTDVMGNYTISILENMIESEGVGFKQLVTDISQLTQDNNELLSIMDSIDDTKYCTFHVTVSAYQENTQWKIHLSQDFIDAFLGYIDNEQFSEEIEQKIKELEVQYENKVMDWVTDFEENKAEKWADNFEDQIEKWVERW